MGPKKKSRVSSTASPAPQPSKPNMTVAVEIERRRPQKPDDTPSAPVQPSDPASPSAQIIADPWTDDEEIGLFKGLVKWKPTGMHKHFHLLSLHQHLLSHGYIHPRAPHTRIPGIWAKLRELYDLEALDERENAHAAPWSPDADDEDDEADERDELGDDEDEPERLHESEFELPDHEFGALMWRARFPALQDEHRDASPPAQPELLPRPDSPPVRFTPSFDVVANDDAPTPSTRGPAAKKQTQPKAKSKAPPRRSSRVADSVDPDNDDNEDQDSEASDDQSEQASTAGGTPVPKPTKPKNPKRSRPAPKSRTSKRRR